MVMRVCPIFQNCFQFFIELRQKLSNINQTNINNYLHVVITRQLDDQKYDDHQGRRCCQIQAVAQEILQSR